MLGTEERNLEAVLKLGNQQWLQSPPKQSLPDTCSTRKSAIRYVLPGMLGLNLQFRWSGCLSKIALEQNTKEIEEGQKLLLLPAREGGKYNLSSWRTCRVSSD